MSKLVPMTQPEFDAFLERHIHDYAADNVRAGFWSREESLRKSREQITSLLPQGLRTRDQYLFTLYDDEKAVGMIWFRAELDRPVKSGFVFYIEIKDEFRGKGYGKQAMYLIEEKARTLGIKQMGLHVFAYNTIARKLYEDIGYKVKSENMMKDLE